MLSSTGHSDISNWGDNCNLALYHHPTNQPTNNPSAGVNFRPSTFVVSNCGLQSYFRIWYVSHLNRPWHGLTIETLLCITIQPTNQQLSHLSFKLTLTWPDPKNIFWVLTSFWATIASQSSAVPNCKSQYEATKHSPWQQDSQMCFKRFEVLGHTAVSKSV